MKVALLVLALPLVWASSAEKPHPLMRTARRREMWSKDPRVSLLRFPTDDLFEFAYPPPPESLRKHGLPEWFVLPNKKVLEKDPTLDPTLGADTVRANDPLMYVGEVCALATNGLLRLAGKYHCGVLTIFESKTTHVWYALMHDKYPIEAGLFKHFDAILRTRRLPLEPVHDLQVLRLPWNVPFQDGLDPDIRRKDSIVYYLSLPHGFLPAQPHKTYGDVTEFLRTQVKSFSIRKDNCQEFSSRMIMTFANLAGFGQLSPFQERKPYHLKLLRKLARITGAPRRKSPEQGLNTSTSEHGTTGASQLKPDRTADDAKAWDYLVAREAMHPFLESAVGVETRWGAKLADMIALGFWPLPGPAELDLEPGIVVDEDEAEIEAEAVITEHSDEAERAAIAEEQVHADQLWKRYGGQMDVVVATTPPAGSSDPAGTALEEHSRGHALLRQLEADFDALN